MPMFPENLRCVSDAGMEFECTRHAFRLVSMMSEGRIRSSP